VRPPQRYVWDQALALQQQVGARPGQLQGFATVFDAQKRIRRSLHWRRQARAQRDDPAASLPELCTQLEVPQLPLRLPGPQAHRAPRPHGRGPTRPTGHPPKQRGPVPPQALVGNQAALPPRPRVAAGEHRRQGGSADGQLVLGSQLRQLDIVGGEHVLAAQNVVVIEPHVRERGQPLQREDPRTTALRGREAAAKPPVAAIQQLLVIAAAAASARPRAAPPPPSPAPPRATTRSPLPAARRDRPPLPAWCNHIARRRRAADPTCPEPRWDPQSATTRSKARRNSHRVREIARYEVDLHRERPRSRAPTHTATAT